MRRPFAGRGGFASSYGQMFGIGPTEFALFLVIVLIVVGPERLPTFMRTVGKGLRQVRRASREFRDAIGLDELMREDPFRPQPPRVRPPVGRPVPVEPPTEPAASDAASAEPGTVTAVQTLPTIPEPPRNPPDEPALAEEPEARSDEAPQASEGESGQDTPAGANHR